jgi:hypothetical protein
MNGMDEPDEVGLSLIPYDEWLPFVFDHPVPEDRIAGKQWYWEYGFEIGHPSRPERLVEHFTALCNQFAELTKRYSLPQIDQGIWFLLCERIHFGQYLREQRIALDLRKSCIHSMYRVYADFVAKSDVEAMENCFQMWWDLLLDDFYGHGDATLDPDAIEIESAMLETLTQILQLDDPRSQEYALHGLGHLKHPEAREVVARYIDAHGDEWTAEGRQWLQQCRDGTVM